MVELKPRAGQRHGRWTLTRRIGSGGNANVWAAKGDDGTEAAIKFVRHAARNAEPYRRFRREVEQMRGLTAEGFAGVLPLVDWCLPDVDHDDIVAWLAMPLATPLREHLRLQPDLGRVVSAVVSLADTVARLADRGVVHRDIKPENCYHHEGSAHLGDLGLVKTGDGEAMTLDGKPLGPRYYLAPEMISSPLSAGSPADVYSLAKTLWVLASGQRFPLPGQHRADEPAMTISAYTPHRRAQNLDFLLERTTSVDPGRRPSAAELRDELSAWLAYRPDMTATANVDVLRSRVLAATTRGIEHHNKVTSRAEQLKAMKELVESYVLRAGEILTQLGLADTGHTPPRPAATPTQSDDAWFAASEFIDFHPLGLTTTQSWVGYDLPTPIWITTAVYLVSGGYIEASVDGSMRVAMLHTIHHLQKTKDDMRRDPLSSAHAWCVLTVSVQEREEVPSCPS